MLCDAIEYIPSVKYIKTLLFPIGVLIIDFNVVVVLARISKNSF